MRAAGLAALAALAACKYDQPPDIGPDGAIVEAIDATVRVTGLWDGAAPVTVILRGGGEPVETSLSGNGEMSVRAVSGVETTVEVLAPAGHACTAQSPVSLSQDAVIAVTCVGPATLALKTPYDVPIPIDATELEVSALVGEADLVVTGAELTRITVDGMERTIAAETRVPIDDITRSGRELAVRIEADTLSVDVNVTIEPVLPITEVARIAVGGAGELGGSVVAVDKDLIVVGGELRSSTAPDKPAVVVYRLRGATWTLEAELAGSDGGAYGSRIAVSDNTILVGEPLATNGANIEAGKVWFWQRDANGWVNTATRAGGAPNANFGTTLAIDGTRAAAGAPFGATNRRGFVQPYLLQGGSWVPQTMISPANYPQLGLQDNDNFGSAIAIRGEQMLVGASGDDRVGEGWHPGGPGGTETRVPGANYGSVFELTGGAVTSWLQLADNVANSSMGSAVGFAGPNWLVGVPFWDDGGVADAGLAYVGPEPLRLLNAAPLEPAATFGQVVAGSNSAFIIGARRRVRVYARQDENTSPLLATLEDATEPTFAASVYMASGSIVIGVPGNQPGETGTIVIYR